MTRQSLRSFSIRLSLERLKRTRPSLRLSRPFRATLNRKRASLGRRRRTFCADFGRNTRQTSLYLIRSCHSRLWIRTSRRCAKSSNGSGKLLQVFSRSPISLSLCHLLRLETRHSISSYAERTSWVLAQRHRQSVNVDWPLWIRRTADGLTAC